MRSNPGTRARRAGIAAALVALTIPLGGADAVAAAPLPVGEASGVRIERDRGELVIVFTRRAAALHRRIAGKRVMLDCSDAPDEPRLGFSVTGGSESVVRVPRRRRTLYTGDLGGDYDYCRLALAPRTVKRNGLSVRRGSELLVSVPLTQAGAVLLDEEARGVEAYGVLLLAGELADDAAPPAYPTAERLIGWVQRHAEGGPAPLVALAAPTDTPPPGDVGYYSDGQRHAAVVTLSTQGRRLFVERLGDDELRTNIPSVLAGLD